MSFENIVEKLPIEVAEMLIRYARVSTRDQNLEFQRDALTKSGCEKIFEDKISGSRVDRPGLSKTMVILL